MRMIARDKGVRADHARRGKPENQLLFACRPSASAIALIVRMQIICTQMISFPRRLDFT
jgi:hypothetical protein